MSTELKIKESNREDVGLYEMCVDFVASADRLKERGGISESEYIELTKLKKQFIKNNKHLAK